jgi:hypothetical protein
MRRWGRALGVVRAVDVAEPLERRPERRDGLQRGHRDLDVDDRLGRQAGHGRGPDVIDALRDRPERGAQPGGQRGEPPRPCRVVVGHDNDGRCTRTARQLVGVIGSPAVPGGIRGQRVQVGVGEQAGGGGRVAQQRGQQVPGRPPAGG